jgi:hypothetical protein
MKRALHSILFGVIFLAALGGNVPAAHAGSCSLTRVAGRYGYTTSGSIPSLGPFAAVGAVSLEASGNFSGTQTTSINGAILEETVSGTYTVNADCTGTVLVNVYHNGVLARTTNLSVVFVNNQREFRAIFLTPGTVLTLQGRKTFTDDDD